MPPDGHAPHRWLLPFYRVSPESDDRPNETSSRVPAQICIMYRTLIGPDFEFFIQICISIYVKYTWNLDFIIINKLLQRNSIDEIREIKFIRSYE